MLTGTQERVLISFIVLTVFGVVQLHLILSHPRGHAPNHPLPCPLHPGIHWVRDPDACTRYFICVAFQPIRMPPCPDHTVWSVSAKNCVPVNSQWDDCDHAPRRPRPSVVAPLDDRAHIQPRVPSRNHGDLEVAEAAAGDGTRASNGTESFSETLHSGNPPRDRLKRVLPNHPCVVEGSGSTYLPHPGRCHWFYNCSQELEDNRTAAADHEGWDGLTEECPYPQLFSLDTRTCQHYRHVRCRTRGLFLDPCEYRQMNCRSAHCQPCSLRHGSCVGMRDGLQPYPGREWTPRHLVCKDQRALEQADCPQDKPIFSPETMRCESLMDIPKTHGGYQISCRGRYDGRFPDETGRCNVFYQCVDGIVQGRFECPPGTVFHPERQTCRRKNARGVPPPCGSNSTGRRDVMSVTLCSDMEDGLYADPYGRCPLYYQCQKHLLKDYHRCDFGSFDPRSQVCQFSVTDLPAPCGDRPNPCLHLPDGLYPDLTSHCQAVFRCKRNLLVSQRSCPLGTVFHREKGACLLPDDTPPPCGLAPSCRGKADGRYASPLKGCQFYFTCRDGQFGGYGRCSVEDGGFYFNARTGSCDFPQNVCAPCGFLTENCTVS